MEFRPVLTALMRNKTGLLLIALQVAITLAIVCNSVFIILQRIEKVNRPSGLRRGQHVHRQQPRLSHRTSTSPSSDPRGPRRAARAARRGRRDARSTRCRCRNGGWSEGLSDQPDSVPAGQAQARTRRPSTWSTSTASTRSASSSSPGATSTPATSASRTKDDKGTLQLGHHHPGAGRQAVPGRRGRQDDLHAACRGKDGPVTRRRRGRAPAGAVGGLGQGRTRHARAAVQARRVRRRRARAT